MRKSVYYFPSLFLGLSLCGLTARSPAVAQDQLTDLSDIETPGQAVFFDTNLSTPPGQSCLSCHDPMSRFNVPDSDINTLGVDEPVKCSR